MKSLTTMIAVSAAMFAFGTIDANAKAHKEKSAISVECSKQADAKALHGKERKAFRHTCKKEMKAQAKANAVKAVPAAPATDADKKS
ncbi:MAG: PsiF family protein [Hyphomicrobium sp.]